MKKEEKINEDELTIQIGKKYKLKPYLSITGLVDFSSFTWMKLESSPVTVISAEENNRYKVTSDIDNDTYLVHYYAFDHEWGKPVYAYSSDKKCYVKAVYDPEKKCYIEVDSSDNRIFEFDETNPNIQIGKKYRLKPYIYIADYIELSEKNWNWLASGPVIVTGPSTTNYYKITACINENGHAFSVPDIAFKCEWEEPLYRHCRKEKLDDGKSGSDNYIVENSLCKEKEETFECISKSDEINLIKETPKCFVKLENDRFTKADLKDGMVVELQNTDRYIILNNKLVTDDEYIPLDMYNDELVNTQDFELSINKVYESTANTLYDWLQTSNLKLVWESNELVKVGDIVKIIDSREVVVNAVDWLKVNVSSFIDQLKYDIGYVPDLTHAFFVKAVAESKNLLGKTTFAYIEDDITHRCYIVDVSGLKKA